MKTLELWLWRVTDPITGRRYVTRHRMTEADVYYCPVQAARA